MMDCKEALPLLHEYLDGGLSGAQSSQLKEHLLGCAECRARLKEYEKVEAMIHAWAPPGVPDDMTEKIMRALPPVKRRNAFYRFIRKHPAASVAAVFAMVMLSSFLSTWDNDHVLAVRGPDLQSVVIKGDTVYVPVGTKVAGDLTVENGKLQVDGDVEGNVVVIDGSVNYASTAHISGQIKQIDEVFSWAWYKMNAWFTHVSEVK